VELRVLDTCICFSTWRTVKCGVTQRSVLCPLLFNICVSDLLGSVDNISNVIMHADDTSILISKNCYEDIN